jgi:hypothetical protein
MNRSIFFLKIREELGVTPDNFMQVLVFYLSPAEAVFISSKEAFGLRGKWSG